MKAKELVGRRATLNVRRFATPGAFLAIDPADTSETAPVVLLPGAEIPAGAKVGDALDVFLYLDSEDRPVATLARPALELDEVAFLEVVDLHAAGAFFDWGLPKHLLVPHAQQTRPLRIGDRHPVGLYLDVSGRLAGTMRVSELLSSRPPLVRDQWVEGQAWRKDDERGVFVIVARRFVALLPVHEPNALQRGESARFRVAHVHPDGKVELTLRGAVHEESDRDVERVFAAIERPDAPRLGDHSPPEEIERVIGISKKAFKRAAGRLYRAGRIEPDERGHWRPSTAPKSSAAAPTKPRASEGAVAPAATTAKAPRGRAPRGPRRAP